MKHRRKWQVIISTVFFMAIFCSEVMLFTACAKQEKADLHRFGVKSLDEVRLKGKKAEDFYQTNTGNYWGLYYIDNENQLYGHISGEHSDSTQNTEDEKIVGMRRIADNVIHVACCSYRDITVFLTLDGKLYVMGKAKSNVLPLNGNSDLTEPTLLMEEVKYALCGKGDIVVLKSDGSVWHWGSLYYGLYDEGGNQCERKEQEPVKVLENAVMISGNGNSHAALLEDGTVWTWGDNSYNQCGASGKGLIEEPVCVARDVKAIWMGKLQANVLCTDWSKWICYFDGMEECNDNLVIKKSDGNFYACGRDIKNAENYQEMNGIVYTHIFMPCRIEEIPYLKYDGLNTYREVLGEYERAQKDEKYGSERWKQVDPTFIVYADREDYKLCYSLADLTGDGTQELILGFLQDGEYSIRYIYAYDQGMIIPVTFTMENLVYLYTNGIFEMVSGSAGREYHTFYQLEKNSGIAWSLEEVYDIPENWGGGEGEGMLYYRSVYPESKDEELTEEEYFNVLNQYGTTPIELEWHTVEGFWNPEDVAELGN